MEAALHASAPDRTGRLQHRLARRRARLLWDAVPTRAPGQGEQLGLRRVGPRGGRRAPGDPDPGWTGRSRTSANPDDTAGTPAGGWVKRRDMFAAASVAAYRIASTIIGRGDRDAHGAAAGRSRRAAVKRGALCVDEVPDANAVPKRPRNSRKENWSREAIDKLAKRGDGVIDKLFIVTRQQEPGTPRPAAAKPGVCQGGGDPQVRQAVRRRRERAQPRRAEQRRRARQRVRAASSARRQPRGATRAAASCRVGARDRAPTCFSGQIRNLLSRLIVSLWRASCLTKHFQSAKKGSDSFQALCGRHPCTRSSAGCTWPTARASCPCSRSSRRTCPRCARLVDARREAAAVEQPPRHLQHPARAHIHCGDELGGGPAGPDAATRCGTARGVFEGVGESKLVASGCLVF